ncbi:hypothetical protein QN277_005690 [Acacia crassicarpa]|uniref:F-box domain-containing protein n=1 Tax=Acacia crassicarpa TaxID=499986 RepID=A0AAE1IZP6_9FABA|nr:hypothetical protein QN277_005690 [Acacia crassicarpa]
MASGDDKFYLQFEIIFNILKRLPVKSIVRFQCVCKEWRDLFKSQSFIDEQVRHSVHEDPSLLLHAYDYNYMRPTLRLLNRKMETVDVLSVPSNDCFKDGWRIIGSCNGWVCVESWSIRLLFLWNPVLREVREIPQSKNKGISVFGFGFSSMVNNYKIVRFSDRYQDEEGIEYHIPIVEVYSLCTDSWKELEFGPLQNIKITSTNAASADGTIVWLGVGVVDYTSPVLVSFDIATEVFTLTPIPSTVSRALPTTLGVYQNKIAISGHLCGSHSMDIWVMEQVDGESGKHFSCTQAYSVDIFSYALDVCCTWKNGIVCFDKERKAGREGKPKYHLKLFNLTDKEWKEFPNISSAHDCCAGFSYGGSLVSLQPPGSIALL